MFDIYKIAASTHDARGDWCSCGETARDCWFLRIYFPYQDACAQASYENLFAQVDP